jgi:hypothetical protein
MRLTSLTTSEIPDFSEKTLLICALQHKNKQKNEIYRQNGAIQVISVHHDKPSVFSGYNSHPSIRFTKEKKYLATKEVCDILATPYLSGWSKLTLTGGARADIGITFISDKPYPAFILKIFAKAKILAGYKE